MYSNKENLELAVNELTDILEEWGNINLVTEMNRKFQVKKLHHSYDKLFKLRKRLSYRLKKLEEDENV